jgi:phosphoribosylformylglycinamidine synthase
LLRASESGDVTDAESEFGSSEYAKEILGKIWGFPPALEIEKESALQKAVIEMIHAELLESAHDCSDGGIAVTLAESAMPQAIGIKADMASQGLPGEFVLFGEDSGRIVISCDPDRLLGIQQIAVKYGVSAEKIGETVPGQFEIKVDGEVLVSAPVVELEKSFEGALEKALKAGLEVTV